MLDYWAYLRHVLDGHAAHTPFRYRVPVRDARVRLAKSISTGSIVPLRNARCSKGLSAGEASVLGCVPARDCRSPGDPADLDRTTPVGRNSDLPEHPQVDNFKDIDHIKGDADSPDGRVTGRALQPEGSTMKIVSEFEASGSRAAVFDLLQDIPSVAQCLPGARIIGGDGGGPFQGTVAVAIGPVSASFEGEATIESDRQSFSGEIKGHGTDKRGGNRGELTLQYRLEPTDTGTTKVCIDVEVELSGPIARFGRTGIMDEIANQLIGDFSSCLDETLSAGSPAEAASVAAPKIKGIRLFLSSAARSFSASLRRITGRNAG